MATAQEIKTAKRFILVLGILFILAAVLFLVFKRLVLAFLVATFLTYLLMPLMDFLEKKCKIRRVVSALLIIGTFLLIIIVGTASLYPLIESQVMTIMDMIPKLKEYYAEHWHPGIKNFFSNLNTSKILEQIELLKENLPSIDIMSYAGSVTNALTKFFYKTTGIFGTIFDIVLIPVFCFFLLKDAPKIKSSLKTLVPSDLRPTFKTMLAKIDFTLKSVIRGQVTLAILHGFLYTLGLSIVGLKFSIAIGVICGICRLVPYMDIVVGVVLSFIVIVADPQSFSWGVTIGTAIVFVVVPSFDGMFMTPKIMGQRAGLHPAVVIASVLAFGYNWGFWGVLIAVPVVAIITSIMSSVIAFYKSLDWYKGDNNSDPDPLVDDSSTLVVNEDKT